MRRLNTVRLRAATLPGIRGTGPISERLEPRRLLQGTPMLIRDVNTAAASGNDDISDRVVINSTLYFTANDGAHGPELWMSDGTQSGTTLVKDIRAGSIGANPRSLTVVGSTLFFIANDGVSGNELWKSDGTSAGTVLVKDIVSGSGDAVLAQLTSVNGALLFRANDGISGAEMWRSDGTSAGTLLLKDIRAGSSSATPDNFRAIGPKCYFSANDGTTGTELWISDGTSAGTIQVRDIRAGGNSSSPQQLTNVNGTLYFAAVTAATGLELFKSDGTNAGTVLVKDVLPGGLTSSLTNLTNVNGTLYFSARGIAAGSLGDLGTELWKSDGTDAGTAQVADIAAGSVSSSPTNFFANPPELGGGLYVAASDSLHGNEIWYSDGTAAGTHLVADIEPGTDSSNPTNFFADPAGFSGGVFVAAGDTSNGTELWVTNGTEAGTQRVKDINAGTASSSPSFFTALGSNVLFKANGDASGISFWKTDGTAAGTQVAVDVNPKSQGSSPTNFAKVGNDLYFSAIANGTGRELWRSDGTSTGTQLVCDIVPGVGSSNPASITDLGGTAYCIVQGGELWKSNGTPATTARVSTNVTTAKPAVIGGSLYFIVNDPTTGYALWKTNNAGNTAMVADIRPEPAPVDQAPDFLTAMGGKLFFVATNPANGREVWISDGTPAGTQVLSDIAADGASSDPHDLVTDGATLWLVANDQTHGEELWRSDGTAGNTSMAADLNPGAAGSSISGLAALPVGTYFTANSTTFRATGLSGPVTPLGTVYGFNFTQFAGRVFFTGNDTAGDVEPWVTDGTAAGTSKFVDLYAGMNGSFPIELTPLASTLYFRAYTPAAGYELYQTDGTAAGTSMVADIFPGPTSSAGNSPIRAINNHLFFAADNGITGEEPWELDAGTFYWTAAGDGTSWDDPNNWNQNQVPTTGDDVIIDLPGSHVIIPITYSASVRRFESFGAHITIDGFLHADEEKYHGGTIDGAGTLEFTASEKFIATGSNPLAINLSLFNRGSLVLEGGARVNMTPGLTLSNRTPVVHEFSISSDSRFDLSNNAMIVDFAPGDPSPLEGIYDLLRTGYNGGAWNGTGIISSTAQSMPNRSIGAAPATALFAAFPATFGGMQVDNTSFLIRYTLAGDANLDGVVNFADLLITAQNYGGLTGKSWSSGDYTYDGACNFPDLLIEAQNYNLSVPLIGDRGATAARQRNRAFVLD